MFDMSDQAQSASASNIQRNRAFQSIDAALHLAEEKMAEMNAGARIFADPTASEGVFIRDSREEQWWKDPSYDGESTLEPDAVLGVISPARYTFEEVGNYV